MTSIMKAVGFSQPGLAENLFVAMREIPVLKNNECLVKVHYSAINRADTLQRKGLYPAPKGESDILGLEAVGTIEKLSNNSKWKINDRVMALLPGGGNAEFVASNEKHLMKIPNSMSFKDAAAIPEVWITAFQLVYWISNWTKNQKDITEAKFLVHAGASGVGTALIQILKNVFNVKHVFATVGSEDKKNYLENELHCSKAFNYKNTEEENFSDQLAKLTDKTGVDVIFDCVGAKYWEKNLECLAVDGEWILYGLLSGGSVNGDILSKILRKRIQLKSSTLRNRSNEYKEKLISDFESKLLKHFESGKLKPIIDSVFNLEEIILAHQRMESNLNVGKILLKIEANEEPNLKEL